jgi:glycosyltransferase involved in cell wall biosynthesis
VRCVIAGHGPDDHKLEGLIGELGLGDDVRLLGHRDDIPGVIRALDVAVLSSAYEGSPLAVMEYMACAAPIVATAVGGVPELIEDGMHGLLVEPHDPQALAAAIGRLLKDRTLASRLGQAASERQRAEFDLDIVVSRLEELYLELYEQARARPSGSRLPIRRGDRAA